MKLVSFRAKGAAHYGVVSGNGIVDLSSIRGPGFGYRADEVRRSLP